MQKCSASHSPKTCFVIFGGETAVLQFAFLPVILTKKEMLPVAICVHIFLDRYFGSWRTATLIKYPTTSSISVAGRHRPLRSQRTIPSPSRSTRANFRTLPSIPDPSTRWTGSQEYAQNFVGSTFSQVHPQCPANQIWVAYG